LIDQLNKRYKDALVEHIEGFEQLLKDQKDELKKRHDEFLEEVKVVVNVEEIHKDFSNLRKLNDILDQLKRLTTDPVKADELHKKLQKIQEEIAKIEINEPKTTGIGSIFGGGSSNSAEVSKLRTENIRLQGDIDRLTRQVNRLIAEKQSAPAQSVRSATPQPQVEQPQAENTESKEEKPADEQKSGWWPFGKRN